MERGLPEAEVGSMKYDELIQLFFERSNSLQWYDGWVDTGRFRAAVNQCANVDRRRHWTESSTQALSRRIAPADPYSHHSPFRRQGGGQGGHTVPCGAITRSSNSTSRGSIFFTASGSSPKRSRPAWIA